MIPDALSSSREIKRLAEQLHLDIGLLFKEIEWALGEQRINTVTPSADVFREWSRRTDGLYEFWKYARYMLNNELDQEEVRDLWDCIDLTLNKQSRKALTFQDYLIVAARSDQKCEYCGGRPPEVSLDIDHVVPVSRGGDNTYFNLRFLCEHHNRSRGNRFRWADLWRRQ
jgi:5-methylcytosine-specific restriction endonuclease McrA